MMHGWTSSHDVYVRPAELLKDKARCIIYDHRGHKESRNANAGEPTMETLASDHNERSLRGFRFQMSHCWAGQWVLLFCRLVP